MSEVPGTRLQFLASGISTGSERSSAMSSRAPQTPTKKKSGGIQDLFRIVNELNCDYNLGVQFTESSSPSKQDFSARIYTRLKIHLFTDGIDAVEKVLREFKDAAKKKEAQWVPKPRADHDTLPHTEIAPMAGNTAQRAHLQKLFMDILDRRPPQVRSATRSFGRSHSGPAAYGSPGMPVAQPKRPAVDDGDLSSSASKRTRSDTASTTTVSASASCRSESRKVASAIIKDRPVLHAPVNPRSRSRSRSPTRLSAQPLKSFNSAYTSDSASTSKMSLNSVFSGRQEPYFLTQDTVEASTQEQMRPPPKPSSHHRDNASQESFPASSGCAEALHKSMSDFEAKSSSTTRKTRTQESSLAPSIVYEGSLPAFSDIERSFGGRIPEPEPDRRFESEQNTAMPIERPFQERLRSIWRTSRITLFS